MNKKIPEASDEKIKKNKEKVKNDENKKVCDRCGRILKSDQIETYGYNNQRCKACKGKKGFCPNCGYEGEKEEKWYNHIKSEETIKDNFKRCKNCRYKIITQVATG
ncbi:MAG: hypothetical protein ACOCP8_03815 [archaeon]